MRALGRLMLLELIVVGAFVIGALVASGGGSAGGTNNVSGKITKPNARAAVPTSFDASGSIEDVQGLHFWLAVRKGKLMWPKEPELTLRAGRWSVTIDEGGTPSGGRFDLVLLAVGPNGESRIAEWIRTGKATSSFPGLESIPGAEELDHVPLEHR